MKHIIILLITLCSLSVSAQTYGDTTIYTVEKLGNDSVRIFTVYWQDSVIVLKTEEDLDSLKVVNRVALLDSLITQDSISSVYLEDRLARLQALDAQYIENLTNNSILRDKIVYDYIGTLTVGISDGIFYGYIAATMGTFSLSSEFNQLFYDTEEQRIFIRETNLNLPDCTLYINDAEYIITNGSSGLISVMNNPLAIEEGIYDIKIIINP